jgi:hypothetical protein
VADETDLYISADVEADGPIPGRYSMLSFGLCVAGSFDGQRFAVPDGESASFYRELRPISDAFVPEALEVSGLDRERLAREGDDPAAAMAAASQWVESLADGARAVLVGFPVVYDWMFLCWYFERFTDAGSPFGHGSALDIKTMYQQKAQVVTSRAGKDDLPRDLRSSRAHSHQALDDALEQAEIFANVFRWEP